MVIKHGSLLNFLADKKENNWQTTTNLINKIHGKHFSVDDCKDRLNLTKRVTVEQKIEQNFVSLISSDEQSLIPSDEQSLILSDEQSLMPSDEQLDYLIKKQTNKPLRANRSKRKLPPKSADLLRKIAESVPLTSISFDAYNRIINPNEQIINRTIIYLFDMCHESPEEVAKKSMIIFI